MFGKWRGQPVDRYYIEEFLSQHSRHIRGHLLEVAGDDYSSKFGTDVERIDILHVNDKNPKATIVGDLTKQETLPKDAIDCFICTQTLQFIYDFKCALQGIHYLLRNNGTVLATATGISKIARYDMQRWGEYWRFTTLSLYKAFSEVFGENNVNVDHYGNVLSAVAFLEGLASGELTKEELDFQDPDYELLVTVVAIKRI
jgi:hypothetical protein